MTQKQSKIPTDPEQRKAYFKEIGSRGGRKTIENGTANRPFSDPEFARKAGKMRGYKFNRKNKGRSDVTKENSTR